MKRQRAHITSTRSRGPTWVPQADLSVEFERFAHRRAFPAEAELLAQLEHGKGVWAEGLPPESLVAVAATLASDSARVLFVGTDDAQTSLRCSRLAPRIATWRVRPQVGRPTAGGLPKLVLCSHEHLSDESLLRLFDGASPDFVFIEDAHMVTPQAQDYRPRLKHLASCMRRWVDSSLVLGVPRGHRPLRETIESQLGRTHTQAVHQPANLMLEVALDRGDLPLVELVERLPRPALLFCATPTQADETYARLTASQIPSHRFHAGLSPAERASELVRFTLPGRRAVMVATSGLGPAEPRRFSSLPEQFGCGYGRSDIRSIVHLCAPASLCQYTQELALLTSAADTPSCSVLTYGPQHLALQAALLARKRPGREALGSLVEALLRQPKGKRMALDDHCANILARRSAVEASLDYLVDFGAVERQGREFWSKVGRDELEAIARQLEEDFDALHAGDESRLAALREFAESTACRAQALHQWLGEPAGTECGVCEACRPGHMLERIPRADPEQASMDAGEEAAHARDQVHGQRVKRRKPPAVAFLSPDAGENGASATLSSRHVPTAVQS